MNQLKAKRRVVKATLTRLESSLNNVDVDNVLLYSFEIKLDRALELFREFNEIQSRIEESLTTDEEIENEAEHRAIVEEKYYSICAKIKSTLKERNIEASMADQQGPGVTATIEALTANQTQLATILTNLTNNPINSSTPRELITQNATLLEAQPKLQLPTMQLPTFAGDYREWPSFIDLYESMVHNNDSLSAAQKFQYLKTALKGEAASTLRHLQVTDANYNGAFEILKVKYDREDYIIEAHLQTLTEYTGLKHASAEGLRLLTNTFDETTHALEALKLPIHQWDCWLNFLLVSKLDKESLQLWRRESVSTKRPTFKSLLKFLENRIFELTTVNKPSVQLKSTTGVQRMKYSHAAYVVSCILCNENHYVFACPSFKRLAVEDRQKLATSKGLCYNCLKGKHFVKECRTNSRCQHCSKKHHSMLHTTSTNQKEQSMKSLITPITQTLTAVEDSTTSYVNVLPTAIILLKDVMGQVQPCRALLDSGSQVTLISENCIRRLELKRSHSRMCISGIGNSQLSQNSTKGKVDIQLSSRHNDDLNFIPTTAYILSKLAHDLPPIQLTKSARQWFKQLDNLADPNFDMPAKIDIILGCDIFFKVLLDEKISNESNTLFAYKTLFGWIISGRVEEQTYNACFHSMIDIDRSLRQFWEIEETKMENQLTSDEKECEEHFKSTHERTSTGQYVVRLPFKNSKDLLGQSRQQALKRLYTMERRFIRDPNLAKNYYDFMKDYTTLNHMEKITSSNLDKIERIDGFYLPHHGVWKDSSSTTKLRVVFDGSCPSSTGVSLNERLHVGPKIHHNLYDILIRFRLGQIGYVADIQKMFRQILVHKEDRKYQKILWRYSTEHETDTYELKTVTYGMSCAPFLALRTLVQLCKDEGRNFEKGAELLANCFYVDDLMASVDTVEEAVLNAIDLTNLLKSGGFTLHKWASNSVEFLQDIPFELRECQKTLQIEEDTVIKTLGLNWHSKEDNFSYTVNVVEIQTFSKRSILSMISRIFDPMGLISPCIVLAKLLLQQLWLSGISWDAPLPKIVAERWITLYSQLPELENLRVPRWLHIQKNAQLQLHGFSDASEQAYAAAIYIRVFYNSEVKVHLVSAKTKVSPIKQVSLPRLELCAAHLLAKLFIQVKNALQLEDIECYGWTDSTIVLAWLNEHPRRWNAFIGNRTSYILDVLPSENWRHVASTMNPADPASRGLLPLTLLSCDLWWTGPDFLYKPKNEFVQSKNIHHTNLEQRKSTAIIAIKQIDNDMLKMYSCFTKLIRITAWVLRFVAKCKKAVKPINVVTFSEYLSSDELNGALLVWVRQAQTTTFSSEIRCIKDNLNLPRKSRLYSLEPFLDEEGVLRVGGRLHHADITYNQRHPIIIHRNDKISQLVVTYYHQKLLHAGGHLLENTVRLKYWIIGLKYLIKEVVRGCVVCTRHRAQGCIQRMAPLPISRFNVGKPFSNTGVDYAGPLIIRTWKGRGAKQEKAYIALFICMTTKAIHLELVIGLSAESFIASFKRFMARRGAINTIYSDNGTNFKGAFRHIKEAYQYFEKRENRDVIHNYLAENHIEWKFIPPSAPHFGGLWEAGVKSVKFHLKRITTNAHLTYDELHTLLCQIELQLNSRPLTPISDNKNDFEALTPGHFITGDALMTVPEIPISDDLKCLRSRWQIVQRLQHDFWKRWHKEYLCTLQQRFKWISKTRNLQINDLVLIMESNLPPANWLMGRIEQLHPGSDQLVRVVTIRTKNGSIRRPIAKLCLLLPNQNSIVSI